MLTVLLIFLMIIDVLAIAFTWLWRRTDCACADSLQYSAGYLYLGLITALPQDAAVSGIRKLELGTHPYSRVRTLRKRHNVHLACELLSFHGTGDLSLSPVHCSYIS